MNTKKVMVVGFLLLLTTHAQAEYGSSKGKKAKMDDKKVARVAAKKVAKKSTVKAPKKKVECAPAPAGRQVKMAGFYTNMEYGFLKYAKSKNRALRDAYQVATNAGGAALLAQGTAAVGDFGDPDVDTITFTKTHAVPLIAANVGIEFTDLPTFRRCEKTNARLGLATSFAKKDAAVEADYLDAGQTVALLTTRQDIKRFDCLVTGEYDLYHNYGLTYSVDAGLGFVVGALRDLKVYQISGGDIFYTGQKLVEDKCQFTGRVGGSIQKKMGAFVMGLGYRMAFSKQKYNNHLVIEKPDTRAAAAHQNTYDNLAPLSLTRNLLIVPPTFNLRSYEFRLTVGFEF